MSQQELDQNLIQQDAVNRLTEERKRLSSTAAAMREKQVYFQLTAAGACIGFAMTQMKDEVLSYFTGFLFLALVFWVISIGLGFRYLLRATKAISLESDAFGIKAKSVAGYKTEPFSREIKQIPSLRRSILRLTIWQVTLLCLGALSMMAWQILKMLARSPGFDPWLSWLS